MCVSMEFIKQILILGVVVGTVLLILGVIIPYAVSKMGVTIGEGMNVLKTCVRYALIAVVAIVVIILAFELIACLISWAGPISVPRR